ncbi:MAG: hypothetical protein FD127_2894 [Acidimicrobiaceae bacterium]|nr:MAG: hypothetical protein FD127_2894 [Acidimicrobiaceae bacterium]
MPCSSAVAPSCPPDPSRHLVVRLQREWDRLSRSPRSVRRARTWGWQFQYIESLDDALALTGYSRSASERASARLVDGDEALGQLVHLARHDELAARLLLQRLLPGIAAAARKHSGGSRRVNDALDEVVAIAWTVIRTFPVERRPRFLAANLLRDIEYRAFVQPWRRMATFVPQPSHSFDLAASPPPPVSATDELAELLDLAEQSGLAHADLELARRLGAGESTAELASACCVTDRTIRNRRDTVTYRLRQVALVCA